MLTFIIIRLEDMANMDLVDEVNEEKDAEELKKTGI